MDNSNPNAICARIHSLNTSGFFVYYLDEYMVAGIFRKALSQDSRCSVLATLLGYVLGFLSDADPTLTSAVHGCVYNKYIHA